MFAVQLILTRSENSIQRDVTRMILHGTWAPASLVIADLPVRSFQRNFWIYTILLCLWLRSVTASETPANSQTGGRGLDLLHGHLFCNVSISFGFRTDDNTWLSYWLYDVFLATFLILPVFSVMSSHRAANFCSLRKSVAFFPSTATFF